MKPTFRAVQLLLLLSTLALAGSQAGAQEMGMFGFGVRGGISFGPDQAVIGAHVDIGQPVKNLRLLPNIELGFGDHRKLFTLNCTARWEFSHVDWSGWMPYVGGELGLNHLRKDDALRRRGIPFDRSDEQLILSALAGIERHLKGGNRWFIETKAGLTDEPDLKLMTGVTF